MRNNQKLAKISIMYQNESEKRSEMKISKQRK